MEIKAYEELLLGLVWTSLLMNPALAQSNYAYTEGQYHGSAAGSYGSRNSTYYAGPNERGYYGSKNNGWKGLAFSLGALGATGVINSYSEQNQNGYGYPPPVYYAPTPPISYSQAPGSETGNTIYVSAVKPLDLSMGI